VGLKLTVVLFFYSLGRYFFLAGGANTLVVNGMSPFNHPVRADFVKLHMLLQHVEQYGVIMAAFVLRSFWAHEAIILPDTI